MVSGILLVRAAFGIPGRFWVMGVGLGTNAKGLPKFNSSTGAGDVDFRGGTFMMESLGRALLVSLLATEGVTSSMIHVGIASSMIHVGVGLLVLASGDRSVALGLGCS